MEREDELIQMSEPQPDRSIPDAPGPVPNEMLTEAEFNAAMQDPEYFARFIETFRQSAFMNSCSQAVPVIGVIRISR